MRPVTRRRRALLALAALAVLWSGVIAATGGFALHFAGLRVSSRNALNPLVIAAVAAVAVIVLARRDLRGVLRADIGWSAGVLHRARARVGASPFAFAVNPVILVALAGALVQLLQWSAARPLWVDEEMIALNVRDRAFADLAGPLWFGQSAPLGWLQLQRAMWLAFGDNERVLRALPVACHLFTLATAVWAGRRWLTPLAATLFVLVCAFAQWISFYALELKHYSADALFALLLPTLAVWVSEAATSQHRLRRAAIWWMAAAVGQWLSNGGVLVAPASALVLGIVVLRRDGLRNSLFFAAMGAACLATFIAHYQLAIRYTVNSTYLREYWAPGMAPGGSIARRVAWLASQLYAFGRMPGGSALLTLFWIAVLTGFLASRRRLLAVSLGCVPLSACALAMLRVVPLYGRIGLWVLPSLYFGLALAADESVSTFRAARLRGNRVAALTSAVAVIGVVWICADIAHRGWLDFRHARPRDSNYALDDRAAVAWLLAHRQPGDAIVTRVLGLPAIWWYGGGSSDNGGTLRDGTPILEAGEPEGAPCDVGAFARRSAAHRRLLVYYGFGLGGTPSVFAESFRAHLRAIGNVSAGQQFADASRVEIITVRPAETSASSGTSAVQPMGCLVLRPAARW